MPFRFRRRMLIFRIRLALVESLVLGYFPRLLPSLIPLAPSVLPSCHGSSGSYYRFAASSYGWNTVRCSLVLEVKRYTWKPCIRNPSIWPPLSSRLTQFYWVSLPPGASYVFSILIPCRLTNKTTGFREQVRAFPVILIYPST